MFDAANDLNLEKTSADNPSITAPRWGKEGAEPAAPRSDGRRSQAGGGRSQE